MELSVKKRHPKWKSKLWRGIAGAALCVSLLGTNVAGVLASNTAVNESSSVAEAKGQSVEKDIFSLKLFGENPAPAAVEFPLAIQDAARDGEESEAGTIFKGSTDSTYTFEPATVVTLNLAYQYSKTGGLAGIDAASPETVQVVPVKQTDGTYKVTWELPTTVQEGFRVVLDPSKLNQYVKNPPTGSETAEELVEKLENGDFDVDIENHTVYYYQQNAGEDTNPTYNNRYSDEYNQAWNDARRLEVKDGDTLLYSVDAVCGNTDAHPAGVEDHGANALMSPKLEVTLTEDQLENAVNNGLNITVNYRRNATWYTVNHWVPEDLAGPLTGDEERKDVDDTIYVRLNQETLQGRVGAMTRATAKTDGVYEQLEAVGFSQQLIENNTDVDDPKTGTTVDIFYKAAESYRVIFDTDYTYIPRQQVALGASVDFTRVTNPTRTGYTFDGWQYLKKTATPDENGEYNDDDYVDIADSLTINTTLIGNAKLQDTGGVLALHLYPKWTPATTNVRVILWTEDLTEEDDVQAVAQGGNSGESSYYTEKYTAYSDAPKTHEPQLGQSDAYYSNMGSFTMAVPTDSSLLNTDKELLTSIQDQVTDKFKEVLGQASGIDVANFYTQAAFEITHEEESGIDYTATTASADGNTMINVYFTRNIYELLFTYYGSANNSDYSAAVNTNGYSFSEGAAVLGGDLIYNYTETHDGYRNDWMSADVTSDSGMPVPKTITIRAKYGADLRDVWPVARAEEYFTSTDNPGNRGNTAKMISWGTTDGKYCEDGQPNATGSSHPSEPTIMGSYAAMGSEIIADPTQPVEYDTNGDFVNSGLRHNLVAYWFNGNISYYRNNHCFEVPDLDVSGMTRVSIYNNNTTNPQNFLYLVPKTNATIAEYGFTDLMSVSYEDGTITYDDPNGDYYAVRQYTNNNNVAKYYAISRQVDTVSSNRISAQNPSARLHMTRVNNNADHSTEYEDTDGAYNGTTCGTAGNPYDLYFYYDRDRYTITYMAPSNNSTTDTEVTLGTVTLPYGAKVTEEEYSFDLDYQDKNDAEVNGNKKYSWTLKDTNGTPLPSTSVCPDRHENGTKAWTFKGWGLGPAGVNMQWIVDEDAQVESQIGEDFAIASNLRLYAIWEAPTYTVTFHLNGGTVTKEQNIEVKIPANTRYSANGAIPRPVRAGYTLAGWYEANENGNITSPEAAFDFDQTIAADKHVAAKWTAVSTEKFNYSIYYVTDTPLDKDKDNDTKEIDGNPYTVLGKVDHNDQMFIANSSLNFSAVNMKGYVPRKTNQILNMGQATDTYEVIFYYDPIVSYQHTVRFVEAGTENETSPSIVKTIEKTADQTIVTPQSSEAQALTDMGYALVNKDNGGYTEVTGADDLKWIDANGNSQAKATLTGNAIPDIVTYLVQPIPYTITYRNADGSPAGATAALTAVTAAADTPVGSAGDKNPTRYTAKDAFTAKNPARVYDNGKWYKFTGWTLGDGTTAKNAGAQTKFSTLAVGEGTVGNLTFVANWEVMADDDLGILTVSKQVAGTNADENKEFTFTVTLDDTTINGTIDGMTFTDGVANFTLHHGQSKTATLPAGVGYKVTETEANQDGYSTTSNNSTGAIKAKDTLEAAFTNTRPTGDLTVSKTVEGKDGDTGKDFTFTVTVNGTPINGDFGDANFVNGTATITLHHDETKTITNLPAGAEYTVTETAADGYTNTQKTGDTGTIRETVDSTAAFTNTRDTGNLMVSKNVVANQVDANQAFNFTVTLNDKTIAGEYGDMTFTDGKATFTLKHDESKTATGLPTGITYTVTEGAVDGYTNTQKTGDTGTITKDVTLTAAFTNTRDSGSLTVSKTVAGNAGETAKDFNFTVTLNDTTINGTIGDMTFANGVATFTLHHGQSKTATLPAGLTYTVAETEADQDGYVTTVNDSGNGTITKDGTSTVAFTNTKDAVLPEPDTGNLTVSKTVAGNAGETDKDFNFTVTLSNTDITGTYGDMTFTDGKATFTLKHGESKTATLPAGLTYTVAETEANQDDYVTTVNDSGNGTITKDGTSTVAFTNTKDAVLPEPDTGNLTVSKTVAGEDGEMDKNFHFTVTLKDTSINGTYGDMTFRDGKAVIALKHGESKTATGLPADITYTVTEAEANQNGYVTTMKGEYGTITKGTASTAAFTNTKNDDKPVLNTTDHYGYIIGYTDGNVRPGGNITRAEVVTIFFRMLTDESRAKFWSQTNIYSDVPADAWYNNAVSTLSNANVICGYGDNTFQPNGYITRAEFASIAVRFFDYAYDGENFFPDISEHWAKNYINIAASSSLVNGYTDGTFRPDQLISRAEAMAIVNRTLDRHPNKDNFLSDMITWPDNADVSQWYYADVQEATNSHEYNMMTDNDGNKYEVWTKMLPVRDWAALEKTWSVVDSSGNSGEVQR